MVQGLRFPALCKSLAVSCPFTECQSTLSVGRVLCLIRVPAELAPFLTPVGYKLGERVWKAIHDRAASVV